MDKRSLIEGEGVNGNILCQLIPEDTKKGILYSPTDSKEKRYKMAKVIVGDNDIKADKTLYLPLHAGTEIQTEDGELLIVNKREIYYII